MRNLNPFRWLAHFTTTFEYLIVKSHLLRAKQRSMQTNENHYKILFPNDISPIKQIHEAFLTHLERSKLVIVSRNRSILAFWMNNTKTKF